MRRILTKQGREPDRRGHTRFGLLLVIMMGASMVALESETGPQASPERLGLESAAKVSSNGVSPLVTGPSRRLVICLLATWSVINAVWSATPGSWLGALRDLARGPAADKLFLRLELTRREDSAQETVGYLRRLSRRRATLYTRTPLRRDEGLRLLLPEDVFARVQPAQRMVEARVKHVRTVQDADGPWYQVEAMLLPTEGTQKQRLDRMLATLLSHPQPAS